MLAHIYKQTILGMKVEDREMDSLELYRTRQTIHNKISQWFRWNDYHKSMTHLLYYVELNGEAYFYNEGYIMDDSQFDELVAMREGVTFAGVIHKR